MLIYKLYFKSCTFNYDLSMIDDDNRSFANIFQRLGK
jgi:hypothetical protein